MKPTVEPFIDRELMWHSWALRPLENEQLDGLLELRKFTSLIDFLEPKDVIRRYFQLKAALEQEHYLLFYRIRVSLSGKFQMIIEDPLQRMPQRELPVDLAARSFKEMLDLAKLLYVQEADRMIPIGDLRCKIEMV